MNLLLDTHIWVWSGLQPRKLSRRVTKLLSDPRNEQWISPISVWEIFTLAKKGRLRLDGGPSAWISAGLENPDLKHAALTHIVALAIGEITLPHSDPADILLAATARVYDLTLLTADENLMKGRGYKVLANE